MLLVSGGAASASRVEHMAVLEGTEKKSRCGHGIMRVWQAVHF
jgi:hypothetical protein